MNKNEWNLSSHNIIVRFPPLSGGRFVMSMLSYFDKFIFPGNILRLQSLINNGAFFNDDELKNFFHYVKLDSLPQKDLRKFWSLLEIPVRNFWGFRLINLVHNEHYGDLITLEDSYNLIQDKTIDLLSRFYCFHLVHESSYEELKKLMPESKIITLVDTSEFQKISSKFKLHHSNNNLTLPELTGKDTITFSMLSIFNKNVFFDEIINLSKKISGDSTFDPRMEEYYDKYIKIHIG